MKFSQGQYSDKGRKSINQDWQEVWIPKVKELSSKGATCLIADGISSSPVSGQASQTTITRFIEDYYCTSELWNIEHAIEKVLNKINSWLLSQTQHSPYRGNPDKGYVCTLSGMIIKQDSAHIFHIGDSRIYLLRDNHLEQLTRDHKVWKEGQQSYLSNAMGFKSKVEFDYSVVSVLKGDIFLMMTDGVYEHVTPDDIQTIIHGNQKNLNQAAQSIANKAFENLSQDNLTVDLVQVNEVTESETPFSPKFESLRIPPVFDVGQQVDNYKIERSIYHSARSHIYLASDSTTQNQVLIKTPSVELQDNSTYLEQLMIEEWLARKTDNPYLLSAPITHSQRSYLYSVLHYFEGRTLSQWLLDNPSPSLEQVRNIIGQVAKGLTALHRKDVLHQDIRPENILINKAGLVKVIDLASSYVTGVSEQSQEGLGIPGTVLYAAPEYFIGDLIDEKADQFSLAILCYYMLSGRFPYGTNVAKSQSIAAQKKLHYQSVLDPKRTIPIWMDETLKKALNPNPYQRYETISEFVFDLSTPNPAYIRKHRPPLLESDPLTFWKAMCFILTLALAIVLASKY